MYKIIQQTDETGRAIPKYTLFCYYYDKNCNINREAWSVRNLTEMGVANLLQGRADVQLEDQDFAFVVVKSGNGPALLTSDGDLVTVPVKKGLTRRQYGKIRTGNLLEAKKRNSH